MLAEFLFSFLVSFLFFFFIFFINQLLVMAEEIFSKKVPFWDVLLFVLYSLPAILALSFPFGALLGALMAVGRFSSDNELLAMRACGLPLRRVLFPLLALGLLLSLVSFAVNDYFLPLGNLRLGRMYRRILYSNPSIELEPFSVKAYRDAVLITGAVEGQQILDLAIIDKNDQNQKRVITAARGRLAEGEGQRGVISIRLEDVFSHVRSASDPERYEYSTAETMIYNILLRDISVGFINPTPREMRAVDVWRRDPGACGGPCRHAARACPGGGQGAAGAGAARPLPAGRRRRRAAPARPGGGHAAGLRPLPCHQPEAGDGPQPAAAPAGVPQEVFDPLLLPGLRAVRLPGGHAGPAQRAGRGFRAGTAGLDPVLGHAVRRAHPGHPPAVPPAAGHVAAQRGDPGREARRC